jgi:hypothetical protein
MSAPSSTALSAPVRRERRLRAAGAAGIAGGILFAAMVGWEHTAGLGPGVGGTAATVDQLGFVVAMAGYAALAAGLSAARPGGDSRAARTFPLLLAVAWLALIAGAVLQMVSTVSQDADPLNPVGGLAQAVGLIGLGVTTVHARRWTGWRRWLPLALAVYYIGVLMAPAFAGLAPTALAEAIWALAYSALGCALLTEVGMRAH